MSSEALRRSKAPKQHELKPEVQATPQPLASPPRPKGVASLRLLKQMYRDWIAAGGTPPIYQ